MLRDAFIFQLMNTTLLQVWMTCTAVPSSFVASFRDRCVEASAPWNLYSLHVILSLHGFAHATKMCPLVSKSDCYTESEYSTVLPWCLLVIISAHANITKNVHEFHIYIIIFNHFLYSILAWIWFYRYFNSYQKSQPVRMHICGPRRWLFWS